MLARVSITSTAPKRATAQDYNGPKAVRDHGRVATKNNAAGDEAEQPRPRHFTLQDRVIEVANFPKDSDGFDSRAADEGTHSSRVIVPNDRKITKEKYDKYCARLFEVSSGGAEITP